LVPPVGVSTLVGVGPVLGLTKRPQHRRGTERRDTRRHLTTSGRPRQSCRSSS
jgi:hypothetical protein